ncbi:hypothetical protein GLOIN_2v1713023 [Rhizophagus irregularis DAOM 181602=DAOM 197198]|nr:hypothetical protein GLOIN_2v1713023 [Rhizophagus irregularis DAOM 181602=DAOM 197198]
MTHAESSSEIFYLRFDHMVAIPMINTGPMNKKTAVKVKKSITPEELSNDKLDMIRRITAWISSNNNKYLSPEL